MRSYMRLQSTSDSHPRLSLASKPRLGTRSVFSIPQASTSTRSAGASEPVAALQNSRGSARGYAVQSDARGSGAWVHLNLAGTIRDGGRRVQEACPPCASQGASLNRRVQWAQTSPAT